MDPEFQFAIIPHSRGNKKPRLLRSGQAQQTRESASGKHSTRYGEIGRRNHAKFSHALPNREAHTFFHPDYTVGPGVSPDHASLTDTRGLYHRSGIVPWSFRRKLPKVRLRRTDTHLAPKVIQLS
jgi:hypothetical protein